MHQNIPGVLIIPNASYENYIQQHPESIFIEEEASALRECIKTEINHVETFLRESQGAKNADKNDFFQKFVDSQLDTDTHHIKLLKANSQLLN